MYFYILGCAIACLCLTGIGSMDTVDVKPAELIVNVLLWPVALCKAVAHSDMWHHNQHMSAAH